VNDVARKNTHATTTARKVRTREANFASGARRGDADGRPDRNAHEVEEWAHEHDLPYFDDQVHFPDLRIEYEASDGRLDHQDVEVTTVHYRGEHGAAAARSGFSCYRGSSARIGGGGGRSGGGRSTDPRLAEEFL